MDRSTQMRLNEARRLMLTDRVDAATAAFQVGYESPLAIQSGVLK
jgi:AraC-like DNA-binding protein